MSPVRLALIATLVAAGCKKKQSDEAPSCPPSIAVEIGYAGASPAEIEKLIVQPIEAGLARIDHVVAIHALAAEGRAVLELEVAGDPVLIQRQIAAVLESMRASLPEDADFPVVRRPLRFERLILAVAPLAPAPRLERIERALGEIAGVEAVFALGAPALEIQVTFDPERMMALGVNADQLVRAVRPAGVAELGGQIVATGAGGAEIRVSDVATISEAIGDGPRAFYGGRAAVVFAIAASESKPDLAAIRAAGVETVSEPMAAATCPRGFGLGLEAITAVARTSDVESLASQLARLPVAVLDGADLFDRGTAETEIIALGGDVAAALGGQPGIEVHGRGGATAFVELTGDGFAELERAAREVRAALARLEGVSWISEVPGAATPEVRVELDRDRLARLGMTARDVTAAVRRATTGEVAAIVRRGRLPIPVRVRAQRQPGDGGASAALQQLSLQTPAGSWVRLGQVGRILLARERSIYRRDGKRRHHLRVAVAGPAAIERVEAAVAEVIAAMPGLTATVSAGDL